MEVVFKKTIVEKMNDAISEAEKSGKEIERFIFSEKEWDEWISLLRNIPSLRGIYTYRGHPILVEWNK